MDDGHDVRSIEAGKEAGIAEQKNLAVIGAGAKAAAIAAKAWCLRETGTPIHVAIFEKENEIGAAWTGGHGYTDGAQRLCTPAERDLGFPYDGPSPAVEALMREHFSWTAFLAKGSGTPSGYADWVNRGRRPPTHTDFARYLAFAIEDSGAQTFLDGAVTELQRDREHWTVIRQVPGGRESIPGFDGVVVTGPGPAAARFIRPSHDRIVDGVSFWTERHRLLDDLQRVDRRIVIVGGGGTAAAIAAWLVVNGVTREMLLLLDQATLFTRTANFFEGRLYNDLDAWKALGTEDREAFAARLNRSVVWDSVIDILSEARNLILAPGRAAYVGLDGTAAPNDLVVTLKGVGGPVEAGLVVDATGFDSWWFSSLAGDPGLAADIGAFRAGTLGMRGDLSLDMSGPRLHLPTRSESQGPGFMSLMVLGAMADHILAPYL